MGSLQTIFIRKHDQNYFLAKYISKKAHYIHKTMHFLYMHNNFILIHA
ncbi:hypothetical protein EAKF1_ch2352c [Escherichia albertii KF1]|nr:hypothetical protein EAKF1_ch2352c [Escherichia albertii KF1]